LLPYLRKKVQAGLPVVGFSAGTVLCGPNVLTSNDLNAVGTTHFAGLNVTPFNFYVHYYEDTAQDDWLSDYHTFNDNPVVLMADNAYIKVDGRKTTLVRGDAWVLRRDAEKEKLSVGEVIVP
jgi:dipeptidase E